MAERKPYRIVFLHHSTGAMVFNAGEQASFIKRKLFGKQSYTKQWFKNYNKNNQTNYTIEDRYFPKQSPYGWNNYPYDYYTIWVKNAGQIPFMDEPTLEILTKEYDLIIFKHCYPVSNIVDDEDLASINSSVKSIANYKLQYDALKEKMLQFPETKFLVWTGAARVQSQITTDQSQRARIFFNWVKDEWLPPMKNIFVFDFYKLATEDTLYLTPGNAISYNNSHPSKLLARKAAELFRQRIIDVIEQNR